MTDREYYDFLVIDFLIQISNGVGAKDCKIRYKRKEIEICPDWASPPGDTISDLLEEKDWGIDQLADLLQLSLEDTNELISGNILITEEIAHKLDQVLGGGAKFWLNREYQYRQQLIKLKEKS